MTLNKFIKELEKLQKKGYGKAHVSINVSDVVERRNDDYSHENIKTITTEVIRYSVDDNPYLADGTERLRTIVEVSI